MTFFAIYEILTICLVLHPRYKSEYFKQKDWPADWISNAIDIARTIWRERYQPVPQPLNAAATTSRTSLKKRLFDDIDNFEDSASSRSTDAFEAYIASPTIKSVKDPLKYWDAQLKADADGGMARFALDYLSAPGAWIIPTGILIVSITLPHSLLATSIDVERAFSLGGLVITKHRNRLSEESARTSIVLASWLKNPEFCAEKEMREKLVTMWKREKAAKEDGTDDVEDMDVIEVL